MRLFIAVDLDDAVRRSVARVTGELHGQFRRLRGVSIAWVRPENLHLTLSFLGEVDEERGKGAARVMRDAIRVAPFDAELTSGGVFPPSGPPRVLWFSVGVGQAPLAAVQHEIAGRLASIGFDPEERPFRAHLTVGRVKQITRAAGETLRQAMAAATIPRGRWHVGDATLYRSTLSSAGPTYAPLVRSPFEAPVA